MNNLPRGPELLAIARKTLLEELLPSAAARSPSSTSRAAIAIAFAAMSS